MMKKPFPIKPLYWTATALWMAVIFAFSAQSGMGISTGSNGLSILLSNLTSIPIHWIRTIVWESGHFLEFLILGLLMTLAVFATFNNWDKKKKMTATVIFCVLYAFSDEIHQLFVPDRAFQAIDLILDTLGSVSGMGITLLILNRKEKSQSALR